MAKTKRGFFDNQNMDGMASRPYAAVESRLSIVQVFCATIAGIGLDGRAGVRRRESEVARRGVRVRRFIQGRDGAGDA